MLPDITVAVFLASCLSAFFGVNLYTLAKSRKAERGPIRKAYVKTPSGFIFALVALGTLLFFVESALYVPLVLLGLQGFLENSLLQLHFP